MRLYLQDLRHLHAPGQVCAILRVLCYTTQERVCQLGQIFVDKDSLCLIVSYRIM